MTGVVEKEKMDGRLVDWLETYERNHEEVFLLEEYLPVSVMRTLVILLTADEEDLFGEDK